MRRLSLALLLEVVADYAPERCASRRSRRSVASVMAVISWSRGLGVAIRRPPVVAIVAFQ
jgi:hypothetical protein